MDAHETDSEVSYWLDISMFANAASNSDWLRSYDHCFIRPCKISYENVLKLAKDRENFRVTLNGAVLDCDHPVSINQALLEAEIKGFHIDFLFSASRKSVVDSIVDNNAHQPLFPDDANITLHGKLSDDPEQEKRDVC